MGLLSAKPIGLAAIGPFHCRLERPDAQLAPVAPNSATLTLFMFYLSPLSSSKQEQTQDIQFSATSLVSRAQCANTYRCSSLNWTLTVYFCSSPLLSATGLKISKNNSIITK